MAGLETISLGGCHQLVKVAVKAAAVGGQLSVKTHDSRPEEK
jgi:hypothetical protein